MSRGARGLKIGGLALFAWRPGSRRASIPGGRLFAQFIRGRYYDSPKWGESFKDDASGRWWRAEIRRVDDGGLAHHAGIHKNLTAAAEEAWNLATSC